MSVQAEKSLIARMLTDERTITEVTGARLDVGDFSDAACKKLYATLVENFYADDPIDAVSVAAITANYLSKVWGVDEQQATSRVLSWSRFTPVGRSSDHIDIVRRAANGRRLLTMVDTARTDIRNGDLSPEEIAGRVAQTAAEIATGSVDPHDTLSFAQAGERFLAEAKRDRAATDRGVELGVKFRINAIDARTHGLQPTELLVGAGEPGVGKSGVWWRGALNFADVQSHRPEGQRVGTLIVSLEMGEKPSSQRIASMISSVDSSIVREGKLTDENLAAVERDWYRRRDYPLWLSHRSGLRASGVRALISDAVIRFNAGLVIIDHFRMFRMDDPPRNQVDHDEEKVIFLKEQIAKAMNLAVVCIAHTRKIPDERKGRPGPSDLRGSDQIRAHADFVNFLFRPGLYATEQEKLNDPTIAMQASFIWAKNRHGNTDESRFYMDPEHMSVW
jgi:replicative DNA helicase